MGFQVFVKFPSDTSYTDISLSCVESLNYQQVLFDKTALKYVRSKYDLTLIYDGVLINRILQVSASDFVDCYVVKDGTVVFTGILDPLLSATLSQKRQTYPVTILDYSVLLDRPIGQTIELRSGWLFNPSNTAKSVLSQLLNFGARAITVNAPTMAGLYSAAYSSSNVKVPYFLVSADDNLLEVIRNLFSSHCYTFRFDNLGRLTPIPLTFPGTITPDIIFGDSYENIIDGSLVLSKTSITEDSIKVKYHNVLLLKNKLGLTDKNDSTVVNNQGLETDIKSCYNSPNENNIRTNSISHCKIVLQTETDAGDKLLSWTDYSVTLFGYIEYSVDGPLSDIFCYAYKYENGILSQLTVDTFGDNVILTNATVSNFVQNKNIIEFDFYHGSFQQSTSIRYNLTSVGCRFSGYIYDQSDLYSVIDGDNKKYLESTISYGASKSQAENVAKWLKKLQLDTPYTVTLDSYSNLNLGDIASIDYIAKGVNLTGIICKKGYSYASRKNSYEIKQLGQITFTDPPDDGATTKTNLSAVQMLQQNIDTATGQLKKPIMANKLPPVSNQKGLEAGLYFGQDRFGYYDGSIWRTQINSDGSGFFSGDIATGGKLKSSNYIAGSVGFALNHDGSAEFSNVTIRGTVISTLGQIGGFAIGANTLTADKLQLSSLNGGDLTLGIGSSVLRLSASDPTYSIWAGHTNGSAAPFSVKKTGEINASMGRVGGFYLEATKLKSNLGTVGYYDRIEIDQALKRVSVFDSAGIGKVAMGYLGGLITDDYLSGLPSTAFGFWCDRGNQIDFHSAVKFNANLGIANDQSLDINPSSGNNPLARFGTDNGTTGFHVYNGTTPSAQLYNAHAKLTNGSTYLDLTTATGALPGYASGVYPVIKTNSGLYFSLGGIYSLAITNSGSSTYFRSGANSDFLFEQSIRTNGGLATGSSLKTDNNGQGNLEIGTRLGILTGQPTYCCPTIKTSSSALYFDINGHYAGYFQDNLDGVFVIGDGDNTGIRFNSASVSIGASGLAGLLKLARSSDGAFTSSWTNGGSNSQFTNSSGLGYFTWATNNNTSTAERMRLSTYGELGFNLTDPRLTLGATDMRCHLTVAGRDVTNVNSFGVLAVANNATAPVAGNSSGQVAFFTDNSGTTDTYAKKRMAIIEAELVGTQGATNGFGADLVFYTKPSNGAGASEVMRLGAGGGASFSGDLSIAGALSVSGVVTDGGNPFFRPAPLTTYYNGNLPSGVTTISAMSLGERREYTYAVSATNTQSSIICPTVESQMFAVAILSPTTVGSLIMAWSPGGVFMGAQTIISGDPGINQTVKFTIMRIA